GRLRRLSLSGLVLRPGSQSTPDDDHLSQVIGIVVRDQQSLAKDGLALAMRNPSEEVGRGIGYQVAHSLQVVLETGHAVVPGLRIRRGIIGRPVAVRKGRR